MPRVYSLAALALLCTAIVVGCGKKDEDSGGGGGGGSPDGSPLLRPRTDDDKKQAAHRLRKIGLALHNFESTNGSFPAGIVAQKGQLGLSWRVAILPYLEEGKDASLYKEFKLDEPWDSEHNKKLIEKMPTVFESPGMVISHGKTYLRSFVGQFAFIQGGPPDPKGRPSTFNPWANQPPGSAARGRNFAGITDGTSNTLMVVEAAEAVEWTKPDELPFNDQPGAPPSTPLPPLPKIGGLFDGGFHGLMCDGSVRFFSDKLDEKVLRALISPNGGEVVAIDPIPDPGASRPDKKSDYAEEGSATKAPSAPAPGKTQTKESPKAPEK
jgi:hypothetical protein